MAVVISLINYNSKVDHMVAHPVKTYSILGCCGLDCGMCPKYYTAGSSRCPGCGGPEFHDKHPSCGYVTCCVKKKRLEACAQCDEFPCQRFDSWLKDGGEYDSFITHRNAKKNMDFIIEHGLDKFIANQKKRIALLKTMLSIFDDGRSRSFYCLATTLLPISDLEESLIRGEQEIKKDKINVNDNKTKAKLLKGILEEFAAQEGVELKLRKKVK